MMQTLQPQSAVGDHRHPSYSSSMHLSSPQAYFQPVHYQRSPINVTVSQPPMPMWYGPVPHSPSWEVHSHSHPWSAGMGGGGGQSSHMMRDTRPLAPGHFAHNGVGGSPEQVQQQRWDTFQPAPLPSSARGPPYKPRQSEFAVWVGNLPPATTVIQLKDHFSVGAKDDIESVFLITKTNCAFVNYNSESACTRAIQRFNENLFRGKRLVCRIRRNSSTDEASNVVSMPSQPDIPPASPHTSESSESNSSIEASDAPLIVNGDGQPKRADSPTTSETTVESVADSERLNINNTKAKAKFFILKSLTLQDLLVSTRDESWSTQPHNEEKLNEAFRSAENVYLLFSVNKSGEYFGYARMEAPIVNSGRRSSVQSSSSGQSHGDLGREAGDALAFIPTPATETAPEGRVIDDSARGTIFWEAKGVDAGVDYAERKEPDTGEKSFAIRWMSNTKVPFYATRGLRNPMNKNREIKIARDGTEVEPWVGWRALQLFNRP